MTNLFSMGQKEVKDKVYYGVITPCFNLCAGSCYTSCALRCNSGCTMDCANQCRKGVGWN